MRIHPDKLLIGIDIKIKVKTSTVYRKNSCLATITILSISSKWDFW